MSLQIPGRADRVFVPDGHGGQDYRVFSELVSMVRVFDKGPDVQCEIMVRGVRAGHLQIPSADEPELRRRLFADPPAGDAEAVGVLIQELEDLASAHDIEGTRLKRRQLVAYIDQLRLAAARSPRGAKAIAQGDGAS
jgi:hypothetical protein